MITQACGQHSGLAVGRCLVPLVAMVLGASLVSGCQVDFDTMRKEHAEQFPEQLAAKTSEVLPAGKAVGLDECVRIALANSLAVETASLSRRLASLDRSIAFSNFLPQVDLDVSYSKADRQQAIRGGGGYAPMSDRGATRAVLTAQQSIFVPETWFLYEMYKKGEDISELLARRTRDLIRLQVTALYYACLSQAEAGKAVVQVVQHAESLLAELQALDREGLVMPSQVAEARTLVKARQVALVENTRLQRETRSALLEAMGLSPMGEITLRADTPLTIDEQSLSDQILLAMLQRPELHIADRTIEIRKDETRIAIAQFLPKLVGFGNVGYSSDSFMKYDTTWTLGVSGVLSVFNGFRNVFEYRAARERETQAAIDREQACIAIMFEVIRARLQFDQAVDYCAVARQETASTRVFLDETEAQWREGLVTTSDKLQAVTRHSTARANLLIAEFRRQVATATMLDVTGYTESEEGSTCE